MFFVKFSISFSKRIIKNLMWIKIHFLNVISLAVRMWISRAAIIAMWFNEKFVYRLTNAVLNYSCANFDVVIL